MLNNSFIKRYKSIPIARYAYSVTHAENTQMLPALEHHREFEIILIREGTAKVCAGEESFQATQGDILFFSPYMLHSLEIPAHSSFSHLCFCFDLSLLSQPLLASRLEESDLAIVTYIRADSEHHAYLQRLIQETESACREEKPFWELQVRGCLSLLFAYLMQQKLTRELPPHSRETRFSVQVLGYLEQHYKEDLNSRIIAKALHYDQSYFCRLFKRNFGLCFHEFLRLFRLDKAKVLLENPTRSITGIAYETGFSGASYFTKSFKKENGITPKQFREKYYVAKEE